MLSFKGLALNLGYGGIGILYSLLLAHIRSQQQGLQPELIGDALKNTVFMVSLSWFPWYLGCALVIVLILGTLMYKKTKAVENDRLCS